MESVQTAIKGHIHGYLREIYSALDEERRELCVCIMK